MYIYVCIVILSPDANGEQGEGNSSHKSLVLGHVIELEHCESITGVNVQSMRRASLVSTAAYSSGELGRESRTASSTAQVAYASCNTRGRLPVLLGAMTGYSRDTMYFFDSTHPALLVAIRTEQLRGRGQSWAGPPIVRNVAQNVAQNGIRRMLGVDL